MMISQSQSSGMGTVVIPALVPCAIHSQRIHMHAANYVFAGCTVKLLKSTTVSHTQSSIVANKGFTWSRIYAMIKTVQLSYSTCFWQSYVRFDRFKLAPFHIVCVIKSTKGLRVALNKCRLSFCSQHPLHRCPVGLTFWILAFKSKKIKEKRILRAFWRTWSRFHLVNEVCDDALCLVLIHSVDLHELQCCQKYGDWNLYGVLDQKPGDTSGDARY